MQIFKPLIIVAILGIASTEVAMGVDFVALDKDALNQAQRMIENHNQYIMPAYKKLLRNADKALKTKRFSVVDKPQNLLAASGNPHDYSSIAPYRWLNPATKNGLPYVAKDGQFNPIARQGDPRTFNQFALNIENLGLAYFFTGRKKYAKKSAQLIRAWFIQSKTRMNPNLNYAQAIPGIHNGSRVGIIDIHRMPRVLDSIRLINDSNCLTKKDMASINAWMADFLDWLRHGKFSTAYEMRNNIGTNYDGLVAGIAIFLGDDNIAKGVIKEAQYLRMAKHLTTTGQNDNELARTRPYHYSLFDLEFLMLLGQYSKRYETIDFYNISVDGKTLRPAVDFLNGYAFNLSKWRQDGYLGKVEKSPPFKRIYLSFSQASRVYGLANYKENLYKAWKQDPTNIAVIKWPIDFSK